MPQNPAITAPELAALVAKKGLPNVYLSYDPMTEVATATVAGFPATSPFTEISTSGESAGWTSCRADMLAIITTVGGDPVGYYRVKAVPIVGTLYVEELDYGDNGLFPIQSRINPIEGGNLISIRETYPIFSVKPFQDVDGTLYQDNGIPVATFNATPDSVYNVLINSQPGDCFKMVANGGTQVIVAAITPNPWPTSSGGTYTYSWSYPASFTSVSGAATATLTATAPVGSHWIYCDVQDNTAGTTLTIKRWIRIHSPADPPLAIKILSRPTDERTLTGRSVHFTLVNARASTIPIGTTAAIWDDATWNGIDVASATHKFVGFINSAPWDHSPAFDEQVLELIGTGYVLDKLGGYGAKFNYTGATDTWERLPSSLQSVQFIMWWILRWRTANVLTRFNFTPFSYDSGIGGRKNIAVDNGSIMSQLQTLASMYHAVVGSRSDGEIMSQLIPSLLSDRTNLITRVTLDNSMYTSVHVEWVQHQQVGAVHYQGFESSLSLDSSVSAQAPGTQSNTKGAGEQSGSDKIFDDGATPGAIVGNALALANNPYPRVTLEMPDNWDILEIPDQELVVVDIPASRSPSGADLTITCVPVSVSKSYFGQRAKTSFVLEGLTQGTPGDVFFNVNSDDTPPDVDPPIVPDTWGPTDVITPIDTTTVKGAIVATQDGYVGSINVKDYSPTAAQRATIGTAIKLIQDPYNYKRVIFYGSQGALVCDDISVSAPTWRMVSLAATSGLAWSQTFDVTISDGGFSLYTIAGGTRGTWVSGVGWTSTFQAQNDGQDVTGIILTITLPSFNITSASITYTFTPGNFNGSGDRGLFVGTLFLSNALIDLAYGSTGSGSGITKNGTGDFSNQTTLYIALDSDQVNHGNPTSGSCSIQSITFSGTGTNPFTGMPGGGAVTFIGDMVGSPNRKGAFWWLGHDSTELYVYRTYSAFQNRARVHIGSYVAGINYSLSLDSYGARVVYAVGGSLLYKSTNYGSSFSSTGIAINTSGGPVNVPYAQSGGAANAGSSPKYLLIKGISTNLQARTLAGNTVTLAAGSSHYAAGPYALGTFTLDGAYCNFVASDGTTWYSIDGGETWTQGGTVTHTGTVYGVTGSPKNKLFALIFGNGCLSYSADQMATVHDLFTAYRTWADSTFGSGNGSVIITAVIDLSLMYDKAVVS